MNVEYELVYEEFKDCCLRELERSIEKNDSYTPIETFIHNKHFTDKPISPSQKKLDKDCLFMTKEISKPEYKKAIEDDGVAGRLAWIVWNKRDDLEIFQIKEIDARRENFIRLVIMIYERGRNRYLNKSEKEYYRKALIVLWNYFNDTIDNKNRTLEQQEKDELTVYFLCMDVIDYSNYKERELNNEEILCESCGVVTDWALQICYETFSENKKRIFQILEGIIAKEAEDSNIDVENEQRRFRKYYSKYLKSGLENQLSKTKNSHACVPDTRIKTIKLLYFASLDVTLFKDKELDMKREEFANTFIKEVFGENIEIQKCINQARILLALCGYYKIKCDLVDSADFNMLDQISDYLDDAITIGCNKIMAYNEIANNWIYTRCIADKLAYLANGKKLSKSRKEKLLEYVKELEGMEPFHIKLQYFQSIEKFLCFLSERSWLHQQKNILVEYAQSVLLKFDEKCEKVSTDINESKDDLIIKMTKGNFKNSRKYKVDYHSLSTKYLKTAMRFMLDMHGENT